MAILLLALVIGLATTLFRPLTVGVFRAGVLLVRPSPRARRLKLAERLNRLAAKSTPVEPALAEEVTKLGRQD